MHAVVVGASVCTCRLPLNCPSRNPSLALAVPQTRRNPEVKAIASPDDNQGVRSVQLTDHLLSFGSGRGKLFFWDLRAGGFVPTGERSRGCCAHASGEGLVGRPPVDSSGGQAPSGLGPTGRRLCAHCWGSTWQGVETLLCCAHRFCCVKAEPPALQCSPSAPPTLKLLHCPTFPQSPLALTMAAAACTASWRRSRRRPGRRGSTCSWAAGWCRRTTCTGSTLPVSYCCGFEVHAPVCVPAGAMCVHAPSPLPCWQACLARDGSCIDCILAGMEVKHAWYAHLRSSPSTHTHECFPCRPSCLSSQAWR